MRDLLERLPAEKRDEAADDFKKVVEEVSSGKPKRKWYSLSAEGLLEAAKFAKDFSGDIAGTLRNWGTGFWPDFTLPAK